MLISQTLNTLTHNSSLIAQYTQAVLRNDFEENDTIIVEAVRPSGSTNSATAVKEANVRSKQRGDGNYTSGLALRKGPKVCVCVCFHTLKCVSKCAQQSTMRWKLHKWSGTA